MTDFVDVGATADVPLGRVRAFVVAGKTITVCHTADGFFATDNVCPHRGGPLAEGDLMGNELVCPWHLWGFDVATGACTGVEGVSVGTHAVRVEGDRILVRVS